MKRSRMLLAATGLPAVLIAIWLLWPGHPSRHTVQSNPAAGAPMKVQAGDSGVAESARADMQGDLSARDAGAQSEGPPPLTPARLARAVEHQPAKAAMRLIHQAMERGMPAAWDARFDLAAVCLPVIRGEYDGPFYQTAGRAPPVRALKQRCRNYDDVTSIEALADIRRRADEYGSEAATLRRLDAARINDGPVEAAAHVDQIVTESRNPYEILAAAHYLSDHKELWAATETMTIPKQYRDTYINWMAVILLNGRLLYCRLASGCGPNSSWVLATCADSGQCRTGMDYREVLHWLKPPLVLKPALQMQERIRALRQARPQPPGILKSSSHPSPLTPQPNAQPHQPI